jgi:hypothetical protein
MQALEDMRGAAPCLLDPGPVVVDWHALDCAWEDNCLETVRR